MSENSNYQYATGEGNVLVAPGGIASVVQHVYQTMAPPKIDPAALQAAKELLASIPVDEVPPVSELPESSHLPWPAHQDFVGRQANLKQLAGLLKAKTNTAISQIAAAAGMGGIGKTQLASAFAHRYGQYFMGGVQWISFADPEALPAEIVKVGTYMFPDSGFTQKPLDEQIASVLIAWKSPLPRLLVFDNCEDEDLLEHWRPPTGGACILDRKSVV